MRTSRSIVPHEADQDTYIVLDDFGQLGFAWRETDVDTLGTLRQTGAVSE
jgi:hypothetical protein